MCRILDPSEMLLPRETAQGNFADGTNETYEADGAHEADVGRFFPKARRLLIEKQGNLTTYDSGDHQISGMQQSGETSSLTFTSQNGAVRLDELKKVG